MFRISVDETRDKLDLNCTAVQSQIQHSCNHQQRFFFIYFHRKPITFKRHLCTITVSLLLTLQHRERTLEPARTLSDSGLVVPGEKQVTVCFQDMYSHPHDPGWVPSPRPPQQIGPYPLSPLQPDWPGLQATTTGQSALAAQSGFHITTNSNMDPSCLYTEVTCCFSPFEPRLVAVRLGLVSSP